MKVLFLGPSDSRMIETLRAHGDEVVATMERLDVADVRAGHFEFLVSYGYRYILRGDLLSLFPSRAINLHISFLPWNRGADPNLWSFVEGTPKGVTIHFLDEGIDTGDIIAQREVAFDSSETLASSYARLQSEIQNLFFEVWPSVRVGKCPRRPQPAGGSVHYSRDKRKIEHLLTDGWNTPVRVLQEHNGSVR